MMDSDYLDAFCNEALKMLSAFSPACLLPYFFCEGIKQLLYSGCLQVLAQMLPDVNQQGA